MLQETTHLGRGAMETDMHVEAHEQSLDVPFLMHVIELFESVHQPEFAIRFAFAALQETSRDDNASQAFLWSVVFKSSLALRDYEQAYLALLSNPHPDSSLYVCLIHFLPLVISVLTLISPCAYASLRKYVVVLCTQSQVGLLCQLPFAGLQQEVVQVYTSAGTLAFGVSHDALTYFVWPAWPRSDRTGAHTEGARRGRAAHRRWSEPQLLRDPLRLPRLPLRLPKRYRAHQCHFILLLH
jgi:hypothetical protein